MTGARMSKGEATRQRLLDAAQRAILEKGFTATSIDELIAECGLTKGGFFYHFKDKNDLAKALLRRYIAEDEEVYDRIFGQARDLVDDPLQVFLLGLKLMADVMGDMPIRDVQDIVRIQCAKMKNARPQPSERARPAKPRPANAMRRAAGAPAAVGWVMRGPLPGICRERASGRRETAAALFSWHSRFAGTRQAKKRAGTCNGFVTGTWFSCSPMSPYGTPATWMKAAACNQAEWR